MESQPFGKPCGNMYTGERIQEIPTPWMHTIPSYMPWSYDNNSDIPNVMKFTASTPALSTTIHTSSPEVSSPRKTLHLHQQLMCHSKRKGPNLDDEIPIANKVYISEEKMAARLNDLHISGNSSQHCQSGCPSPGQQNGCKPLLSSCDLDDIERTDVKNSRIDEPGPKLILSPELQNLQKTDPILPPAILQKLQKSCMQLMVWKPPESPACTLSNFGTDKIQELEKRQAKEEEHSFQSLPTRATDRVNNIWSGVMSESKEVENESMEIL